MGGRLARPEERAAVAQGHGFHLLGEREALGPRVDDRDAREAEVRERGADRGRQPRSVGALALDAEQLVAAAQEQIDLCALVRRPEEGLVVP